MSEEQNVIESEKPEEDLDSKIAQGVTFLILCILLISIIFVAMKYEDKPICSKQSDMSTK